MGQVEARALGGFWRCRVLSGSNTISLIGCPPFIDRRVLNCARADLGSGAGT